ncbi:MAG: ribosome maturation factor RimP [Candidatus Omnitrophica bacterium]|nr:ribosome maturation factor RimP [Candidatus Omnitrophota bacterium]
MDKQEIFERLRYIIQEVIMKKNLQLVDLVYRYEGRTLVLRILVDKPEGGITLQECAQLNNELSKVLDEEDILKESYILEVSSPGLDRPLKTKSDFLRCINRRVRVSLKDPCQGKREWVGVITKVEEDSVIIEIEKRSIQLPLSEIIQAKQLIDLS